MDEQTRKLVDDVRELQSILSAESLSLGTSRQTVERYTAACSRAVPALLAALDAAQAENARLKLTLDNSLYAESLWSTASTALQEAAEHFDVVAGTHKADVAVMLWEAYRTLRGDIPPTPKSSLVETMDELRKLVGKYYDGVDPDALRADDTPTEGA